MSEVSEAAAAVAAVMATSGGSLGFQDALDYDVRTAATVDEAAKDTVEVFANTLGWGMVAHFTFREVDVLATLAHRVGRTDIAQALMLEWAQLDEDSRERLLDLQDWGVEYGPGGWAVTGGVAW